MAGIDENYETSFERILKYLKTDGISNVKYIRELMRKDDEIQTFVLNIYPRYNGFFKPATDSTMLIRAIQRRMIFLEDERRELLFQKYGVKPNFKENTYQHPKDLFPLNEK